MKRKSLKKKKLKRKGIKFKLKHDQELRNDWPEISQEEWERIETDEAFRDGFILAINNVSIKINEIRKSWNNTN